MTTEAKLLREALRKIKHEAVSLADAQVIALEALSAPAQPESGEAVGQSCREACELVDRLCTNLNEYHCAKHQDYRAIFNTRATECEGKLKDLFRSLYTAPQPAARVAMTDELAVEKADGLEQARIIGIGAERELALMAELAEVRAERDEAHQQLALSEVEIAGQASSIGHLGHLVNELRADIANLHTTMMAAAVEIQAHWDAHCDAEGYGPANLMHRLERGIASQYGYDAKTIVEMQKNCDSLRAEVERLRGSTDIGKPLNGLTKEAATVWLNNLRNNVTKD
jgi:hypothetical protein